VGCLRNAAAVAKHVASQVEARPDRPRADAPLRVAVVAAGERWSDGTLRVAYEDHVGAGAVITRLVQALGDVRLSPEARVAALAFERLDDLSETPSGRELLERGFADDVAIAAQVDASSAVPVLCDGSFTAHLS
jgi:2-phosphosulfolactate phosphatase